MAPGPPNLGKNRFALLSDSPPKKRKNNKSNNLDDLFPPLPTTHAHVADPKFLILSSKNNNKTLAQFSCFAIHKSLLLISKDILSVSELRDGNLLILVKNSSVASKFLECKSLQGVCDLSVKLHDNLNLTKGTVYAPFLNSVPEKEIVDELGIFGVVSAYKFQKNIDGKQLPSGVVLLSFNRYNLPTSINIAWRKVDVREYFPNPMRCKSCQLLGHTIKFCKRSPVCVHCNLPPHPSVECSRSFCANCFGNHSANSPMCPKFQQSKEILKIKTVNKCSLRDALKKYKQLNPTTVPTFSSYSAAVNGSLPKSNTISPLQTPLNHNSNAKTQSLSSPLVLSNSPSPIDHTHTITATPSTNNKSIQSLSNISSAHSDSPSLDLPCYSSLNESNLFTPIPNLNKVLSASQISLAEASSDDMSHSD